MFEKILMGVLCSVVVLSAVEVYLAFNVWAQVNFQ